MYIHSASWLFVMIISFLYHICLFQENTCVIPLVQIQNIDHAFSTAEGVFILLEYVHFLHFIPTYVELILYFFVLGISLLIVFLLGGAHGIISFISKAIVILIPIVIITIFIIKNKKETVKKSLFEYHRIMKGSINILMYVISIGLGFFGFVFFVFSGLFPSKYFIFHGLWHALISFGVVTLLLGTKH